jgi:hypothetical protein
LHNKTVATIVIFAFMLTGCTSIKVAPLTAKLSKDVCIEENTKVAIKDFMGVLRNGFEDRGFRTSVFRGAVPENCQTVLTYTATRKWDLKPYMTDAELWLRDGNGSRIGYAQYHLNGGGGLALNKWASTESKMQPVFEELLAAYPLESGSRKIAE